LGRDWCQIQTFTYPYHPLCSHSKLIGPSRKEKKRGERENTYLLVSFPGFIN
jgi:hypothetical protein